MVIYQFTICKVWSSYMSLDLDLVLEKRWGIWVSLNHSNWFEFLTDCCSKECGVVLNLNFSTVLLRKRMPKWTLKMSDVTYWSHFFITLMMQLVSHSFLKQKIPVICSRPWTLHSALQGNTVVILLLLLVKDIRISLEWIVLPLSLQVEFIPNVCCLPYNSGRNDRDVIECDWTSIPKLKH